jgi:hypothetical protein
LSLEVQLGLEGRGMAAGDRAMSSDATATDLTATLFILLSV